jgi:hypothetical protein
MVTYYKRKVGTIAVQSIKCANGFIGYSLYIVDKFKEEIPSTRITVNELHHADAASEIARHAKKELVTMMEDTYSFKPDPESPRSTKVRFSKIRQEFEVERKEKTSKKAMLAEWDAFGQSMRLLGLCEEDDVITLIDDVLGINTS